MPGQSGAKEAEILKRITEVRQEVPQDPADAAEYAEKFYREFVHLIAGGEVTFQVIQELSWLALTEETLSHRVSDVLHDFGFTKLPWPQNFEAAQALAAAARGTFGEVKLPEPVVARIIDIANEDMTLIALILLDEEEDFDLWGDEAVSDEELIAHTTRRTQEAKSDNVFTEFLIAKFLSPARSSEDDNNAE